MGGGNFDTSGLDQFEDAPPKPESVVGGVAEAVLIAQVLEAVENALPELPVGGQITVIRNDQSGDAPRGVFTLRITTP